MKRIFLSLWLAISVHIAFSQQAGLVSGVVKDTLTGELLFTVNVYHAATAKGTTTDFDGKYSLQVPYGKQTLSFSLVGYETIEKTIDVNAPSVVLNIDLASITLKEVTVTSSFITDERKTPYSITTIQPKKIQEELASQDLPMVLNSTPGVYATQQGGGDGDARITIRGFNQRNVAVMVDGVPVNDMEVGWVYWSNWFGLDMVTRSIQVQRGLGASKIAIPSIGGTMNIITKGLDSKGGSVKQEVGTGGFLRTSFSLSTGRNEKGWGITTAFSYKRGNGWVNNAFTEGYFYFIKIEKQYKKHLFSLTAFGAPQKHAQRSFKKSLDFYNSEYAAKIFKGDTAQYRIFLEHSQGEINDQEFVDQLAAHGVTDTSDIIKLSQNFIDTTGAENHGMQFNEHWGYLYRTNSTATDTGSVPRSTIYERLNYFHKPQITLKDFWNVNDKLSISTLAYLSVGNGGGTGLLNTPSASTGYTSSGQINFQSIYTSNKYNAFSIDPLYSTTEHKSGNYIRSSVNNHRWVGLLSTFNYLHSEELAISGGIDFRDYVGEHYREIYDLLGGDYAIDINNNNADTKIRRIGEKVGYNNDGLVRWGGIFGQAEYKKNVWSAFLNVSGAYSGYKRIDYFRKKSLELNGHTFEEIIGYGDVAYYNGDTVIVAQSGAVVTQNGNETYIDNTNNNYDDTISGVTSTYTIDSKEAEFDQTKWKWIPGYTIKGGASYLLNEDMNIFMNIGLLSRTPRFTNVIDNGNNLFRNYRDANTMKELMSFNEKIYAVELGYGYKHKKIAFNFNSYYTYWKNRPLDYAPSVIIDDISYTINVTGLNALHKGVEFDFAYSPISKLTIEGSVSLGQWTWESGQSSYILDDNGQFVIDNFGDTAKVDFDATDIHVGDAAQTQFAGIIRYEFLPDAYIKARFVHFSNQYANFDPYDLQGENERRESWEMPAYGITELHAGYRFKLDKIRLDLRGSIINLFNVIYLSDAQNNDSYVANTTDFDAKSASVFYGQGRRYNISLQINF